MPRYVFVATLLMLVATPALAVEYYVVQDPTTKKCSIVKEKPDGKTMIMVGPEAYATKEEAKAAKKANADCKKKEASN